MTPEERQKRIEALEAEIAELKKPEKTAGQRFWELVSETEIKFDFDKYPNTIFGFRGDNYVWEFDFKNNYLCISLGLFLGGRALVKERQGNIQSSNQL